MPRTPEQAYDLLIQKTKEHGLLNSCASVLGWDERTYMPRQGSTWRAEQLALLARLAHELRTAPEVGQWLAEVEGSSWLRDAEEVAANVRELRRGYDRAVKMPKELVVEIARVTTRAQQVWQEARQADDYGMFQPWLEKIIRLKREEADAVGYQDCPYDALLDEYEPGATTAAISRLFAELRQALVPLVEALVHAKRQPRTEVLERHYPIERQKVFGEAAAAAIGFDFSAGRLDETAHPFCSGIAPGDCRLTTRYHPHRFSDAFFGTLHEAGHGIYEQGLEATHFGTPLGSAVSLGIHESQSRLWENFVGRGRPFWEHFFPLARGIFHEALQDVSLDDFVGAINHARPSLIRVEADEVTYNLHIIARFEMEQALLTGDLPVNEVPSAWNDHYRRLLQVTPPNSRLGCLQDIHWSMGGLGYFPTYTLGNLYAAQFMQAARQQLGDLDANFRRGDFRPLQAWLRDQIHRWGQRYRPDVLCQRVTGQPLSPQPLLTYLQDKYGSLYEWTG
ncbi:MAG: carboxypeptidase M32 [Gemmataceae bacterium]